MFMIFWSGFGLLTVGFAASGLLVGAFLEGLLQAAFPQLGLLASLLPGLGVIGGAVANWIVGRRLNARPDRVLTDQATGRTVIMRRRHTLYFLPMQWWSIGIAVLGVIWMWTPPA